MRANVWRVFVQASFCSDPIWRQCDPSGTAITWNTDSVIPHIPGSILENRLFNLYTYLHIVFWQRNYILMFTKNIIFNKLYFKLYVYLCSFQIVAVSHGKSVPRQHVAELGMFIHLPIHNNLSVCLCLHRLISRWYRVHTWNKKPASSMIISLSNKQ